jgi:hypothetical protein
MESEQKCSITCGKGVFPGALTNWEFSLTRIPEGSMKKWDVYLSGNIRQQLRIAQPLIFN